MPFNNNVWKQEDIDTLVELRNSGKSMKYISEVLGKTHNSVKMYVQRHKDELGLKPYIDFKARAKSQNPEFDRQWYGSVPFGHWAMTKPWRKQVS
jgi:IS30 family transposase